MPIIRGSRFKQPQTEVQVFPEEYFSAADCQIWFADVYNDQITGLQFRMSEKVAPLYGYASRTWDYVMRGSRFVQGSFRMAFRETGYLYTILDHIGQHKDKNPAMAYLMQGQPIPKWHGQVKQTIEQVLKHWAGPSSNPQRQKIPRWEDAKLQQGMTGNSVKELQLALFEIGFYFGSIDGVFGEETKQAVISFQFSKGYTADGVVESKMKNDLAREELVSNHTDGGTTINLGATFEPRVLQYERDIWGRSFLAEAEDLRKHESYFYRLRETQEAGYHAAYLFQNGFDIYINYGPLAEHVISQGKNVTEGVSFNTTVKAIRNIQLTDVEQILDPNTGQVIEEVYQFIAQDLD